MNYRELGKTGKQVSALGFGMMRLPCLEDKTVDLEKTVEMVRYAIDNGVNYIDTAYGYHDGKSESVTGKVLADGYREKVTLVTKAPWWEYKCAEDFDRILDIQLGRLNTDRVDIYLLHALDKNAWKRIIELGIVEKAQEAKKRGKFGLLGFSFHDSFETFKTIVDYTDWDVCQIQLNYLDEFNQAGVRGLEYAAAKGMGVIIMEPLRGGKLANVGDEVGAVFADAGKDRSPVEWALDWLWDKPQVSLLLSGMGNIEQVKENIASASRATPGMLDESDRAVIEKAYRTFSGYDAIPCTGCEYCIGCPKKINIPATFAVYNEYKNGGNYAECAEKYRKYLPTVSAPLSDCASCGYCEGKCPQHIAIRECFKKVSRSFVN